MGGGAVGRSRARRVKGVSTRALGAERVERGAWLGGALLLIAYLITLAPSVTLWDSGEFLSAIHTLGIPHPPGTPLFVLIAHAWRSLVPLDSFALVINAASALATATACTIFGSLAARWTSSSAAGFAAALLAGTMAAVWQSATETEVYAYSLLLVATMLAVAERAGDRWSDRHRLLVAYLFGLAVALHISALVAAPGIVYLAATDTGARLSVRRALSPLGAFCLAAGLGTVSIMLIAVGVILVLVGSLGDHGVGFQGVRAGVSMSMLVMLGATAVLFMLVRAPFDPGVNQGNPSTWNALLEVVGRRQYDVPPLWPRRAPFWLQVGNMIQYADWQAASALSDWPGGSWRRTPFTIAFLALGTIGSVWHRRRDRRSWNGIALLLAAASLGVVVVLNLRAGPSYGFGVLPEGAIREARERDYFFALAFAVWGVWCGCGVGALVAMRGRAFIALACVPLVLNWRALDRTRMPEARLAEIVGEALLQSAPTRAVLVMSGDNDSYPVWFAQRVLGQRADVAPVTIPLLAAGWYRAELARRDSLLGEQAVVEWLGLDATLREIATRARASRRALTAAVSVLPSDRQVLAPAWTLRGMVYLADEREGGSALSTDTAATLQSARFIDSLWLRTRRDSTRAEEWTARYIETLLKCPSMAVRRAVNASAALLESTCNYR